MADITPLLSTVLVDAHSLQPLTRQTAQLNRSLDAFLREAYQINSSITSLLSYLRSIRQPYLSAAPPPRRIHNNQSSGQSQAGHPDVPAYLSDSQREDIDHQTAAVLHDIDGSIKQLSMAASMHTTTATQILEKKYGRPSGLLWRWAAGDGDTPDAGKSKEQIGEEGKVQTTSTFREGVVWYLNYVLAKAVTIQQEMIEIRLDREREKRASVLYDTRNKGVRLSRDMGSRLENDGRPYGNIDLKGHDAYSPTMESGPGVQQELSPEQLQLFEEENSTLLNHYTDTLAKVTQVEKSLLEISSLQQTLVGHLSVQGEMVGQLVMDAANTDENVRRGNKELKKASERSSTAKGVFWGTLGLCSFLVVWDLVF